MISNRLLQIAKMIDKNRVVFDVGSDHALLPCFLVSEGICDKVYAGDIALGPLDNASKTIEKYGLTNKVIPIFSDGLKMAKNDVDVVTIAGMGYFTIEKILDEADISKYQYLIVQSNKDVDLLRDYINRHHYTIEDEAVVYDDFYYEIVKFSADLHDDYSSLEVKYGPILLSRMDDTFVEYMNYRLNKLININLEAKKKEIDEQINEIKMILKI